MLKGRHLVEPRDFSVEELEKLFALAERIAAEPGKWKEACRGNVLATLFFEPSTRTRLSFEAAMLRLGGACLGFAEPGSSSAAKGESLADTIRTVACYADAIAMRNPKEGAALLATRFSDVPVINAGDGGHHHPTQTLTDLLTIRALKGGYQKLTVGFCGDLRFGRTVHSLAKGLSRYPGNRMVFVSPQELRIPEYITRDVLKKDGIEYREEERLENVIGDLDVLYMTRVQKERFPDPLEYERVRSSCLLTKEMMQSAKKDCMVMHALPRVDEIDYEIDKDPRAAYFKQAGYGVPARMALISYLLGLKA